ncbi:MAG: F0F1 ATP synthase subunit beta, partial [Clostridia bacterium]|nr:F0F1 ATP synthase subunit beta [Clostridia bacterium]
MNRGKIVQVIGPVVDVQFPEGNLPEIYNAVKILSKDQTEDTGLDFEINITMEAMQHLGNNSVRCVALSSTGGLQRGMVAVDTGGPIK